MIGVDFDNTIVCYDQVFHSCAVRLGLVPANVPATKQHVRDHLRGLGRNDVWTRLQGEVYGPGLSEARPYPGVDEFFVQCHDAGLKVAIVSHKTEYPAVGPQYDLHEAAHCWLQSHCFYESSRTGLTPEQVYLEPTREAKIRRAITLGINCFIDDLPECLVHPELPESVRRILFDPHGHCTPDNRYTCARTWASIADLVN